MASKEIGRLLFVLMYAVTCIINFSLGINSPEVIKGLSQTAIVPILGDFIDILPIWMFRAGLFAFAVYQFLLVFLLSSRDVAVRIGMIGAVVFHIGIIPFGWFNLFNLVFVLILIRLVKNDYTQPLTLIITSAVKKKRQKNI